MPTRLKFWQTDNKEKKQMNRKCSFIPSLLSNIAYTSYDDFNKYINNIKLGIKVCMHMSSKKYLVTN